LGSKKSRDKTKTMRVLSLFDGISCGRVALQKAGITPEIYYASEIDKYAIKVSEKNYPDIVRLGDVREIKPFKVDLLIGGSPCQDLSIAKKNRKGLEGERSGLFWEYVRLWKECEPTYFILENVASMSKKDRDTITKTLGVEPILFNASLVSAQSRKRLFWTNIKVTLPEDKGILLKDILESNAEVDDRMVSNGKAYTLTASYNGAIVENSIKRKQRTMVRIKELEKSTTLSNGGAGLVKADTVRKLTPVECERLQCLPDNYTEGISNTQRYKCLGNGFNAEVIAHILSSIK
jgi:site-specific DNA-cytosine methylase